MVRKIMFTLIALTLMLFAGCDNQQKIEINDFESCAAAGNPVMESYPAKCSYNGETYTQVLSLQEECEFNLGKWIDEAKECEGISNESCLHLGGNFESCASACRNNPDAEMCTEQCVQVCEFNVEDNDNNQQQNFRGEITNIENGKDGYTVTLVDQENNSIKTTISISNLDSPESFNLDYVKIGNILDISGESFEMNNETYLIARFANLVYSIEEDTNCKNNGGEYQQLGMLQIYQCNMPTNDAWQSCNDVNDCEGTCFAENGVGVCSELTKNFGCFSIMKDGKEQGICID